MRDNYVSVILANMGLIGFIFAQFVGVAAFGATSDSFPCDRFLSLVNQSQLPAMSIVYGTFGDNYSCVASFLHANESRPHLLQVHFSNEVCRRNHRCTPNDFFPTLSVNNFNREIISLLGDVAERTNAIYSSLVPLGNTNTIIDVSIGLEDNYNSTTALLVAQTIKHQWPWVLTSRSPETSKFIANTNYLEDHGSKPSFNGQACIANPDGTELNYSQTRNYIRRFRPRCVATFIWRGRFQGRTTSGVWIPYEKRTYTITNSDIVNLGRILQEETR